MNNELWVYFNDPYPTWRPFDEWMDGVGFPIVDHSNSGWTVDFGDSGVNVRVAGTLKARFTIGNHPDSLAFLYAIGAVVVEVY